MVESMHHSSEQYLSDVVMIQGSPGIVDEMDMFDFEDESNCCCNVSFDDDDDDEVLSSSNNSTHSATTNHLLAGTVKAEEKMSGIGGNSFSPTTSASVIQKQLLSIYNSIVNVENDILNVLEDLVEFLLHTCAKNCPSTKQLFRGVMSNPKELRKSLQKAAVTAAAGSRSDHKTRAKESCCRTDSNNNSAIRVDVSSLAEHLLAYESPMMMLHNQQMQQSEELLDMIQSRRQLVCHNVPSILDQITSMTHGSAFIRDMFPREKRDRIDALIDQIHQLLSRLQKYDQQATMLVESSQNEQVSSAANINNNLQEENFYKEFIF